MSHAYGLRELLQEPMLSWRCHQLSSFGVVRKRPFVMLIDYSCSEAGVRMAFLGRVLKWEKRGDYYVLKATDVLGRKLAVCFVWPCLVDEEAKAPRA